MRSVAVEGGVAALAALREAVRDGDPYSLALLDVNMPEMDRFTLAEEIRRDPQLARMPLIMLTSGNRHGEFERSKQLGIAVYLIKPVQQAELLAAIGTAFGGAPPVRQARPVATHTDHGLRILLAEDNPVNQRVAVRMLEKRGYRLQVVDTGCKAVAAVEEQSFDLVLMDIQMPEMDGLTATALIRKAEAGTGRHMPVVAMTAHAMTGDRERFLAAGMDDYIAKPFEPAELDRVIDARRERPEPPPAAPREQSTERVFDRAAALRGVGGDEQLLAEVAGLFLEECPRVMAAIRAAEAAGDAAEVHRRAHSLKGSVGFFGPGPVMDAARRLESLAGSGDPSGLGEEIGRLSYAVDRLIVCLTGIVQPDLIRNQSGTVPTSP